MPVVFEVLHVRSSLFGAQASKRGRAVPCKSFIVAGLVLSQIKNDSSGAEACPICHNITIIEAYDRITTYAFTSSRRCEDVFPPLLCSSCWYSMLLVVHSSLWFFLFVRPAYCLLVCVCSYSAALSMQSECQQPRLPRYILGRVSCRVADLSDHVIACLLPSCTPADSLISCVSCILIY